MVERQIKKFIINFAISGTSAIIAKTMVAPADRIKLILQNQEMSLQVLKHERMQYKGIVDILIRVPKEQGILSFWRGNGTNIIRYFPTQALNFSFNDVYKYIFDLVLPREGWFWNAFPKFVAGGMAGASTVCIVYPLDFCQTKLSADIGTDRYYKVNTKVDREYSGLNHCLTQVYQAAGLKGFYGGLKVAVFGIAIYRSLYFGIFDLCKKIYIGSPKDVSEDFNGPPLLVMLLLAQTTAIIASSASYPFDTVMRRLMIDSGRSVQYRHNKTILQMVKDIYRTKGVRGFYKGLLANFIRCTAGSLVLVLYDEILHYTHWKKLLQDNEAKGK